MKHLLQFTAFLLALSLLLIIQPAVAQSDYRPGYVVPSQGDTLQGLVSYRTGIQGANVIGFKQNEQATVVTYTPKDISGYGFPNDKNFQIKLLSQADTLASEPVFMEELVRGNITLYNYEGTFYVQKQDTQLHKLYITTQEYYNSSGALAKRHVNHHISTLNMLMGDCFRMLTSIERVKLTQKNLVELVQEYNQCTSSEAQTVFKDEKPWIAVRVGVIGGISRTSLNFSAKDESYLHLEHASFNSSTSPTLGLALSLNSPRINEHAVLQLEGRYFRGNFKAEPSYTWFGTQYDNEIEFDLSALKLSAAVRYHLSGKRLQPFVNVGGFVNFFQQRDYTHRQYVKRTSTSTPEERINDDSNFVVQRQQGILAGAGTYLNLKKTRLSVEARYELGLDLHTHAAVNKINNILNSNTRTLALLLGYYF